tara:strand:+ start:1797 stop:2063 length:267 start_codon:yes stop_codon:yes gene_type:complete
MNTSVLFPQTFEEYEEDCLKYVLYYTISEFLGRGKYKRLHKSKNCAKSYKKYMDLLSKNPNQRLLRYAICQPPCRALTVNIYIGDRYG